MRTVTYFQGGVVADFQIPDDRFDAFSKHIDWDTRYQEDELHKASKVLAASVSKGEGLEAGAEESLAACYVWNYFNSHPEAEKHIEGDILIVDLEGDGETIEFAASKDVQLVREQ